MEDMETTNSLFCVLTREGGNKLGFVAMSGPDCGASLRIKENRPRPSRGLSRLSYHTDPFSCFRVLPTGACATVVINGGALKAERSIHKKWENLDATALVSGGSLGNAALFRGGHGAAVDRVAVHKQIVGPGIGAVHTLVPAVGRAGVHFPCARSAAETGIRNAR